MPQNQHPQTHGNTNAYVPFPYFASNHAARSNGNSSIFTSFCFLGLEKRDGGGSRNMKYRGHAHFHFSLKGRLETEQQSHTTP